MFVEGLDQAALDRHITGNYGEDGYTDYPECEECEENGDCSYGGDAMQCESERKMEAAEARMEAQREIEAGW